MLNILLQAPAMPSDIRNQCNADTTELASRWDKIVAQMTVIENKLHKLEAENQGDSDTETELTQQADDLLKNLTDIALTACDRAVHSVEDARLLAKIVLYFSDPEIDFADRAASMLAQAVIEETPPFFVK